MVEPLGTHVMLLQLVAAQNDELLGTIFPQHDLHKLMPKRPRPASHQHHLFRPIHRHHRGAAQDAATPTLPLQPAMNSQVYTSQTPELPAGRLRKPARYRFVIPASKIFHSPPWRNLFLILTKPSTESKIVSHSKRKCGLRADPRRPGTTRTVGSSLRTFLAGQPCARLCLPHD